MEMYSVLRSYRTMGGFAPAAPAETRMTLNEDRVADLVAERIEVRQNTGVGSVAQPATYMTYSHFYTPKTITTRAGRR
jgi:hypothetical protein